MNAQAHCHVRSVWPLLAAVLALCAARCGSDGPNGFASNPGSGTETIGIMGVFVDQAGVVVQGARVAARAGDTLFSTFTGVGGSYLLDSMIPGVYRLEAVYGDSELVALVRSVRADSITYLYSPDSVLLLMDSSSGITTQIPARFVRTDTMYAPGAIAGTVLAGSGDMSGTHVYVPGTSYAAWTNGSGDFTLTGIPPGVYDLQIARVSYSTRSVRDIVVHAARTTVIAPVQLAYDTDLPPPAPTGLSARYDTASGSVHIRWNAVHVGDMAGYRVYVDNALTGLMEPVSGVVRDTQFVHAAFGGLAIDSVRFPRYQVKAIDTTNDESLYSQPVTVTVVSPLMVRTSIAITVIDTARQQTQIRAVAACANPTRRNVSISWYLDTQDSAGLLRTTPVAPSGTFSDTLSFTLQTLGVRTLCARVTDNGGGEWSECISVTVEGFVVPNDTSIAAPQLNAARRGLSAAVAGGRIYALGGMYDRLAPPLYQPVPTTVRTVESIDGFTGAWQRQDSLGAPRYAMGIIALGDTLLAFGGSCDTSDHATIEMREPTSGQWRTIEHRMPSVRSGMSVCAANGSIYVVGGITDNGTEFVVSNTIDRFDLTTGEWHTVATMSARRAYHQAVVYDGAIRILGGFGGAKQSIYEGAALNTSESFDLSTETVSAGPPIGIARMHFAAVVHRNRVVIMGGVSSLFMDQVQSSVVSISSQDSFWRTERDLEAPLHSFAACSFDNAIVIIGGSTSSDPRRQGETRNVWRYYP